jgi:putative peptidoglycan lipid II flippase
MTAEALFYYAVGLWAFSVIRIIDSAFFSIQDRKSPLKVAFIAIFVNVACSIILMFPLKHGGLALATSIASAVNVIILSIILKKKIGVFLDAEFYHSLLRTLLSSLMMWGALIIIRFLMTWNNSASFQSRLSFLAVSIAMGLAAFLTSSWLLKNREMIMLMDALKRIGRRKPQP